MKQAVRRYFIAVLPPPGVSAQVRALQTELSGQYQTRGALRSPPHITLHMPFNWRESKEAELIAPLAGFIAGVSPFTVFLKGYGAFAPRVIYLNVLSTSELTRFQQELSRFCRINLNLLNATPHDLPYHPHVTLAFRDLKKQEFFKAWEECRSRTYEKEFDVTNVHLLRHENNEWKSHHAFSLNAKNPQ
jgi:2'-5' RNA ligase